MNLEHFFYPQTVAIIGASSKKGKVGNQILFSMKEAGFKGKIFPVNPNEKKIQGIQSYPDLKSIDEIPELVIIATPSRLVPMLLQQCADMKIKAIVVLSTGFKESDTDGILMETSIVRIAKSAGIEVIGPNCIGLMSPAPKLNASFAGTLPKTGSIGYFSQSGSIMAATVDKANSLKLGFSKLINIGNKADINEMDIMKAFAEDSETKVITGYLETFTDGDAFMKQAERISRTKPILLIKSGVTPAGAKAASSHTGRLTGTETVFDCFFERAGVIRCESIKTQLDFAQAFSNQPIPAGPNVVIIASAGGAGIMATDSIEKLGLSLAILSKKTVENLSKNLPNALNINNPIELLGNILAKQYEIALKEAIDDPGVDIVLVMLTPHELTQCIETVQAIVRVSKEKNNKPILACLLGSARIKEAVQILQKGKIPPFDSPEIAVAAIKAMVTYSLWRSRPKRVVKLFPVNRRKVEKIIEWHLKHKKLDISEIQTKKILEAYGFVIPKGEIATTVDQAVNIANQLGYPVALKIWSPEISHKTEIGGVKINLNSEQYVRDAFDLMMYRIPQKRPDISIPGILVEEMCKKGMEVILGMNRDPRFGPLMMFGMGGKLVEILKDVAFYPAPLTAEEAKEMLVNTRTYHLLSGIKGEEGVDIDAIAEGLQRLSQLVTEFPQIKEMDINPFVVGREGTIPIAVDAKITLESF